MVMRVPKPWQKVPAKGARIVNWADFAAPAVGTLRYEVGRHPDDRRLAGLVEELRAGDPDVAQRWDDQRVTFRTSVTKHVAHPIAEPLTFAIESVVELQDPEQRLAVYTVELDPPTARVTITARKLDEHAATAEQHGRTA